MTLTKEKFDQGMTTQEYIEQIKVNKQPFLDIYNAVKIPESVLKQFDSLPEPLSMAVFTADWCGDALSTTPVILKLADSTDQIALSVFNRDDELELAQEFLPEDRSTTVPIFILFSSSMEQIAIFIETANSLVPPITEMDEMIDRELAAESEANARTMRRGKRTTFRVAHAQEWANVILDEFGSLTSEGLSLPSENRPTVGGTKWPHAD